MRKRPKYEPTDSYFYLARQLAKCTMIADALNLDIDPVRTEMTGTAHILVSHVFSTDARKIKEFLVTKTLLQICSTDENESKGIVVDEYSTEEDESERIHKIYNIKNTQRMRQSMRNLQLHMK